MSWFRKKERGFKPAARKQIPDGLWTRCLKCGDIVYRMEVERMLWTCPKCEFHFRVSARQYVDILADEGVFEERDGHLFPKDPLRFRDVKRYTDRLRQAQASSSLTEAILCGSAKIGGYDVELGILDFSFMGGSMGSVVGEKVARAAARAEERSCPLAIVSSSGGARMQEGILSLMQMAKTSALLARFSDSGGLYISILAHPTTGGVTASFATLGDVIIAEPGALVGFAGPRVIQQTINQELPEGFQRSEFLLEHGMVDMVVHRMKMKETLVGLFSFFLEDGGSEAPLPIPRRVQGN
jgi:acetyl-CoA carboxylase carboxyl transferase subunit beta